MLRCIRSRHSIEHNLDHRHQHCCTNAGAVEWLARLLRVRCGRSIRRDCGRGLELVVDDFAEVSDARRLDSRLRQSHHR